MIGTIVGLLLGTLILKMCNVPPFNKIKLKMWIIVPLVTFLVRIAYIIFMIIVTLISMAAIIYTGYFFTVVL